MFKKIRECLHLLIGVLQSKNKKTRDKLIKDCEQCFIEVVRDICFKTLRGKLDLTVSEKDALNNYKITLRKLASVQTPKKVRRALIYSKSNKILKKLMPPLLRKLQNV